MRAIAFENVTKTFHRHTGRELLRSRLARALSRSRRESFHALRNVSFAVEQGESLGIVGNNGAGKSTLLSLIAGLCTPDEGRVTVNGRVAPLFELGSGFHVDLTGAENLRLNAALLGLSRRRTAELFDQIVEFSGIGEFIGEPLRTYSSGMVMRLAFSIAINMDPDILLIDEVLAVGDAAFQEKCVERIDAFRRAGKTLVCVSHSAPMILKLCQRAVWLDHGEVVVEGAASEVLNAYMGRPVAAQAGE
ncbi:MAG: ABC transporter ATP-binding protein [bacterium]